jgi:hexosaminidase
MFYLANNLKRIWFKDLILMGAFLFSACGVNRPAEIDDLSGVHVHWEFLGNRIDETSSAAFTFVNNTSATIDYSNWALYFNQNTLHIGDLPDAAKGVVEHINGDLYRFKPGYEFLLQPGDSITVSYHYRGFMIKESDAPAGAYFVMDHDSEKERVFLPSAFTKAPFADLEAIFPVPDILSTVPTAANQYHNNQFLNTLPKEKIGKIIPGPYQVIQDAGKITVNSSTTVYYQKGLESEASILVESVKRLFGININGKPGKSPDNKSIQLELSPFTVAGKTEEAYELTISESTGIQINGSDPAGVFYGIQSLLSLLWADSNSGEIFAESIRILDAPRFAYRGFLLDVARNFQQKKDVLRLIDLLSAYKINKLNLRLTDDEGWRIEINGLPELTRVGARRGHTQISKEWLQPAFGSGPFPDSEGNHGTGYYTREDFKEIIRYARQRHIEVIPEICFPSHARAAIKAMEARHDAYLAKNDSVKANEFRLIDPEDKSVYLSAQMYKDNIANVALPGVYRFYETVISDMITMYSETGLQMTTFNTGGDEVPKGAWSESPISQELMNTLPHFTNTRQLQGYFLEKMMPFFERNKLLVTGWEEVVLEKDSDDRVTVNPKFVNKNILPLVWDNTGENIDLGYRIANAGYPVVLCNVTNLYFDLAYNTDPKEPGLFWGGFQDAIDPYVMAPFDVYKTANFDMFGRLLETEQGIDKKQTLNPDNRKNIIGLQAQLWSETVKGAEMMEYYLVPKIFAFAEKAWAQAPQWESEADLKLRNKAILNGWNKLANSIGHYELDKIERYFAGYNYRLPPPGAVMVDGKLNANISFPGLTIRYTTDGTEPTTRSAVYLSPVAVSGNVQVRSFDQSGRGSRVFRVD